jgi:hypothetical protein
MKRHFEPLAIASNVAQGANTRGDQVLLLFGKLFQTYKLMLEEGSDTDTDQEVIAAVCSLESRWSKTDQDFFIACLFLNPWVRLNLFDQQQLPTGAIVGILSRLYCKVFRTEVLPALIGDVIAYRDLSREFAPHHWPFKDLSNAKVGQLPATKFGQEELLTYIYRNPDLGAI